MPKTIRELANELKVSKQTIQYHYQRLPAKSQQKDSQGANMISLTAERIIRDKVAKRQQTDSKKVTNNSKENNEIIVILRKEVEDLKSQIGKQLDIKDQRIDHLTKLLDQQQQLQLTIVSENKKLKDHVQRLSGFLETSKSSQKRQGNDKKEIPNKDRIDKVWWYFC